MEFHVLGDLEVYREGMRLPLGSPLQRSFLTALLRNANEPVSLAELESLLWDTAPPSSAMANVRTYAAGLRHVLGDRLVTTKGGYQLAVEREEFDLHVYEAQVSTGRAAAAAGDVGLAVTHLRAALSLWRGRAGASLPEGTRLRHWLAALDEERLLVAEDLFEARLAIGSHTSLVRELRGFLADHPLRERACGQLMVALFRCGDVAGALNAFQCAGADLDAELGLDPGPELSALHQAILAGDASLSRPGATAADRIVAETPSGVPKARALAVPNQLPVDPSHLVGRDRELAAIAVACQRTRGTRPLIVAIEGMPGIGKSAILARAAHRLAEEHPDGVLYADLHGRTGDQTAEQLLQRFVRSLGGPSTGDSGACFRSIVSGRRVLLVLDGVTSAGDVHAVLPAEPCCTVLFASRRRLTSMDVTLRLTLGPLDPSAAEALLTKSCGGDRIQSDPSGTAEIVDLCAGLPLALRIAAAKLAKRPDWQASYLARRLADEPGRITELAIDGLAVRDCFDSALSDLMTLPLMHVLHEIGLLDTSPFDAATLATMLSMTAAEVGPALELLHDIGLIEAIGPETYHVHELVRLYCREISEFDASSRYPDAWNSNCLV
jgi:DNA-binding SARP family transcriptional activator